MFNPDLTTLSVAGAPLFVGGGLANWIDRVTNGMLIDFLNVGTGPLRSGISNAADLTLELGLAVVLIAAWRRGRRENLNEINRSSGQSRPSAPVGPHARRR